MDVKSCPTKTNTLTVARKFAGSQRFSAHDIEWAKSIEFHGVSVGPRRCFRREPEHACQREAVVFRAVTLGRLKADNSLVQVDQLVRRTLRRSHDDLPAGSREADELKRVVGTADVPRCSDVVRLRAAGPVRVVGVAPRVRPEIADVLRQGEVGGVAGVGAAGNAVLRCTVVRTVLGKQPPSSVRLRVTFRPVPAAFLVVRPDFLLLAVRDGLRVEIGLALRRLLVARRDPLRDVGPRVLLVVGRENGWRRRRRRLAQVAVGVGHRVIGEIAEHLPRVHTEHRLIVHEDQWRAAGGLQLGGEQRKVEARSVVGHEADGRL